ncbi:MAG: sodium:alanine symporter family protein [Lachnospiraceae bacterium]|nr:sodium:alanine symporter family protein [Lachnospiraceae bacterium]
MERFFDILSEWITNANDFVNEIVWGPIMIALLLGTGIYLTLRLGIPQLTRLRAINRATFGKLFGKTSDTGDGTIASRKAGLASIACVVGTGNITGVATAVHAGGPGALFWMWLSAFFGMATKFAEIILGIYFREKNARGEYVGGAMYYIYKGLKSKWMAYFFCLMAIFSYMVCGAIVDTNSICLGIQEQWNIAPWISGLVIAAATAVVILGGVKRIGDVCDKLTPIMSVIYIIVGLGIILLNIQHVPGAFREIFVGAFTPQGAAGGFAGATVMQAMTVGLARGLNSNEAGMGSSPTLNCAATVEDPVEQGYWGVLEVFLDTIIICTITGLVIVLSGQWTTANDGTALAMVAFGTFLKGGLGNIFIMISTILFGYSCLITSNYLCEVSADFMWGPKSVLPIRLVWIAFIMVGALGGLEFVWDLADTANGLMAIPNLIGLLLLSPLLVKICRSSAKYSRGKKQAD